MTPPHAVLVLFLAVGSLLPAAAAQCTRDSFSSLPPAPVFPSAVLEAGQTPRLDALVTGHWSEVAVMARPAFVEPVANPAQTGCPHLSGQMVDFHTLGFAHNQDVNIPANTRVLVSSCSVPPGTVYRVVTVPASSELIFGDAQIHFEAHSIHVFGKLLMGSETCRLRNKVTLTLHGKRSDQTLPGHNRVKGILAEDATVEIHGAHYTVTWTRLAKTVSPGDDLIFIQDSVNWQPGQTILVTTTELKDSRDYNRNEERIIQAVFKTPYEHVMAVRVTEPFSFKHFAGRAYQAEVALLSRNIVIQGDAVGSEPTDTQQTVCFQDNTDSTYPCNNAYLTGFGVHIRIEGPGSIARFSGVEVFRAGQTNILGRYAIHFHMCGQSIQTGKLYIQDSSVHRSYYRAYAIHGTNNVTLSQNVAYDVIGHAYFVSEDGVEELNTIEFNLGAYVHWMGDTQLQNAEFYSQKLDYVHENPNMILPSDSAASVFYITNSYNYFLGNAASGGWTGFAFPNLPRPVKLHQSYKNGEFTPQARPLLLFKGNTAHSTAFWFGSAGGIYIGGLLEHSNGLGSPLRYTAGRASDRDTCELDPKHPSQNGWCSPANYRFMHFEDNKVFLANRGAQHWGSRSSWVRTEVHDVGMSMNVFGVVHLTDLLVQCRSIQHLPENLCSNGNCLWRDEAFWTNFYGFQWYDVHQTHIMTKAEFRNCDPNWPHCKYKNQCGGAAPFTMLTHSNEFVPEIMQATREIKFTAYDPEMIVKLSVEQTSTQTVSGRLTNWIDMDGSIFPNAFPGQPVILGSIWARNWWKTHSACLGPKNNFWICPKRSDSVASLYLGYNPDMESKVGGSVCPNGAGPCPTVGQITHWGRPVDNGLLIAQNPKITGPIIQSSGGWFVKFNSGTPKNLRIMNVQVHPDDTLMLAIPYPAGTTFSVKAVGPSWCSTDWARCQDTLVPASSIAEVRASFGDKYFFDSAAQLLYYRVVQRNDGVWPKGSSHTAWPKHTVSELGSFTRDNITIMIMNAWETHILITASNCGGGTTAYCNIVSPDNVPPAAQTEPPVLPSTYAPTLPTMAPTRAPTPPCADRWEQCGGDGWLGCCTSGNSCIRADKWYAQCKPSDETLAPVAPSTPQPTQQPTPVIFPLTNRPTSPPVTTNKPTTASPTRQPTTSRPSLRPTKTPTIGPTPQPTTLAPTPNPTPAPSKKPTMLPTKAPTRRPTKAPTRYPTKRPTKAPTRKPTKQPTAFPTKRPTKAPTRKPTKRPTPPTLSPTKRPTKLPTKAPTRRSG